MNFSNETNLILTWPNLSTFIVCCSPFTIVLNAFVLLIAFRYLNFNVRFEQIFVVNMTTADFLFGLIYMTSVKNHFQLPLWFCRPYYALSTITAIGSVMFLLLLNVHKLVTLFFPLHAMIFMSKQKILAQVVLCWTIILICCTVYVVEPNMVITSNVSCNVAADHRYYAGMVAFFYILPLTISLIISVCIFALVQKKARRTTDTSKERRKLFKRILFVFISTVWTAITCLPYRILLINILLCRSFSARPYPESDPCGSGEFTQDVAIIFQGLLTLGSVMNPIITVITQSKYSKGAIHLWRLAVNALRCGSGYVPPSDLARNTTRKSTETTLM